MSRAEIEALAEALARRLAPVLAAKILDDALTVVRSLENSLGAEADRIARQICAKLEIPPPK